MNWIDFRSRFPLNNPRRKFKSVSFNSILKISEENRAILLEEALKISTSLYVQGEEEDFIQSSKLLVQHIDASLKRSILHQLNSGNGYVLIKGLPNDLNLPETPQKGGHLPVGYKETFINESILIMLGSLLDCEIFNFRQEGFGSSPLIDNIVPLKGKRSQKGAGGFDNKFPFHCESAWHRKRPDYLILLGVREDKNAKTLVFSSCDLKRFNLLGSSLKYKNSFRLKAPQLYAQMEKEGVPLGTPQYAYVPPIDCASFDNLIKLNLNFNGMESTDLDALNWLRELEKFIEDNSAALILQPGTAVILNNDLTCHTRTSFSPKFSGVDRWFLRGYFKKNLWDRREDIGHLTHDEINRIRELGWIDKMNRLNDNFRNFLNINANLSSLDNETIAIINKAFYLTPFKSDRIV